MANILPDPRMWDTETRFLEDIPNPHPDLIAEINGRRGAQTAAYAVGQVDNALNMAATTAEYGSKASKFLPRAAAISGRIAKNLHKVNGYTNVAVNAAQGALTVRSRQNPYGEGTVPWWTPALDAAEGSTAFAGPWYPVVQTLVGGEASRQLMLDSAAKMEPALRNNPSEATVVGRQSYDWGRNQFSQTLTGGLADVMNERQSEWEAAYHQFKSGNPSRNMLQTQLNKQGANWADYNAAQSAVPWPIKSYYGARELLNTGDNKARGEALDDFIAHGINTAKQEKAVNEGYEKSHAEITKAKADPEVPWYAKALMSYPQNPSAGHP